MLGIALTAVACNRIAPQPDPTFGRSYDECVLKNASKGGDADARQTATTICARHFIRAATAPEAEAAKARAEVDFAPPPPPPSVGYTTDSLTQLSNNYTAPMTDGIHADVRNSEIATTITQVVISGYFYHEPPGPDGKYPTTDKPEALYWTIDTNIEPNQTEHVSGTFIGGHAPTRNYNAWVTANRMLPLTGH